MSKENKTYKAIFENEQEVFTSPADAPRIIGIQDEVYTVEYQNAIFHIGLDHFDPSTKTYVFEIEGKKISLKLKDSLDLLVEEMGMDQIEDEQVSSIEAPMPGLVIDICVKEGEQIKEGSPLLILEAMKMENIIKAKSDVIIEKIHVNKSDAVDKSQLLISFQQ